MENTLKFIESYPGPHKPKIIHLVSKGLAEVLRYSDDLNGKLVFGKFYKHKNVKINLLAQLE